MKIVLRSALICAAVLAPAHALAQSTSTTMLPGTSAPVPAYTPAPPIGDAATAAPTQNAVLRVGTPVPLTMSEELTTKGKKLRVGERFQMATSADVLVDGRVVIPAGSPAVGEVTDVRNKGMWGKSGHINARMLYVTVNGRQIRLSGQLDDKGVTGTAGVVASVALLPVAGFFTTGTSAKIPMGAPVNAFVDEDVALAFATAAPAPLVVPAQPVPLRAVEPAPVATPPATIQSASVVAQQ